MIGFVKGLIKVVLCHIGYRVEYVNSEVVQNLDKCVLCPNHSNAVEPAWIYAHTDHICIMAKAELFRYQWVAKILHYFGVFPIHRGEKDVRSLIHAINLFRNVPKRKLLVFPEGTRIPKSEPKGKAKVGPFYIACKAEVPLVPVYITKNAPVFSKVKIIYGEPMYLSKELAKDKDKLHELAEETLDKIYRMGEQEKHGKK